ncbi:hypothetical protein DRW07_11295 [Alteromonas sediminis]|uniref:Glutamate--cysteine ligase n=1 Tax=Alteromonas sediminis TaxID=2259342 RepID=A0A3N5XZF0_9ALTE|nr:glutamate-cysteine ligase family protein [Alteromonas sediminis]RPJ66657.1 hypothetical protein DRW07_11295 [Alteromonas sediminis]
MGQQVIKANFTPSDFAAFHTKLDAQLAELKARLAQPQQAGLHSASFGAELELYLVDTGFIPQRANQTLLALANDKRLTEELNQYNLEINLSPVMANQQPFTAMHNELRQVTGRLQDLAASIGSRALWTGILPTLKTEHLALDYLTDSPRFRALAKQLSAMHDGPFQVDINHFESLDLTCDEVTLEGANASFQVHFKVPESDFVPLYNAAQLVTPLALALSANSPVLMGKKLWHETRIALFKQSIDSRVKQETNWRQPARVTFGQGWLRKYAWEPFAESVALYEPILPSIDNDSSPFAELLLHHGTVWSWNRAIFDPHNNGHLRIEFRALPSGPTLSDMVANAAFIIGLTQAFSHNIDQYMAKLPFQHAEYNFYRAAKQGLDAKILWPCDRQYQLIERPIIEVLPAMLPMAEQGLEELNVDRKDISQYLAIIEQRIATRQTGATWQLNQVEKLEQTRNRQQALEKMLSLYQQNMLTDNPVANWTL